MLRKIGPMLFVVILSLVAAVPVLADAPAAGLVVEGQSVPGVALGSTRAQVEAAYGEPQSCTDLAYYDGRRGIDGICDFNVNGGGQVTIYYRCVDGSPAKGSLDDIVFFIRWTEAVGGWATTAGVNTTLAKEDPEAVVAAYPNAEVTRTQWGTIIFIKDYELGIEINRSLDFYSGTVSVSMAISAPSTPPPPREPLTRVTEIDLTAAKSKGQRQVRALVRVQDDRGLAAAGATVSATWVSPDGSTQAVEDSTSSSGYAYFELNNALRGTYTLLVNDVTLEGHQFDREASVLSASIKLK